MLDYLNASIDVLFVVVEHGHQHVGLVASGGRTAGHVKGLGGKSIEHDYSHDDEVANVQRTMFV